MRLRRKQNGERGGSLMEYMLLVTLVAVVCIAGAMALGGLNSGPLNDASGGLNGQAPVDGDQPPADGDPPAGGGDSSAAG